MFMFPEGALLKSELREKMQKHAIANSVCISNETKYPCLMFAHPGNYDTKTHAIASRHWPVPYIDQFARQQRGIYLRCNNCI